MLHGTVTAFKNLNAFVCLIMEQLIFFAKLSGVAAVEAEQNVKTVKAQH